MIKAVLFKSEKRFNAFRDKFAEYGIECIVLDFAEQAWMDYDFSEIAFVIYYPSFEFTSNHPLALQQVYDNLMFIHSKFPGVRMYPDPKIIHYYNDKYRQFLFLHGSGFPIPRTIPLFSEESVKVAEEELGFPMVIKNRYGASGGSVFRVFNRKELLQLFRVSRMDFGNYESAKYFLNLLKDRGFYYYLLKEKRASYPFLSSPLLAQEFVTITRDLKTVVRNSRVVEAHWRYQADKHMWKVNIDAGGVGVWGKVDQGALDVSERLARELDASWINLDLIERNGEFLITEFSPVWHHYAYKEKPSFVYREDYNIDVPLEVSLDLEKMIIESLLSDEAAKVKPSGGCLHSGVNALEGILASA